MNINPAAVDAVANSVAIAEIADSATSAVRVFHVCYFVLLATSTHLICAMNRQGNSKKIAIAEK